MNDKTRNIKDILFGSGNNPANKTFAETSTNALAKNQYEVTKNSTGNFLESVVYEVPINDIDQSDKRFQMRLPNHDISEIKKSIEEKGQQTPAVLLQMKGHDKFIIISGFTRTQSICELRINVVKAFIKKDIQEVEALTIALIENEARKDLTDWERIQGVVKLVKGGKTVTQVAADIGKKHSIISLYQKVYDSKESIREALKTNQINFSQANALANVQDKLSDKQIEELISKSKDLSVQNTKNVIAEILKGDNQVGDAVQKEKNRPKSAVTKKKNRFAVNINFKKVGEVYKFKAKFIISKDNKEEVREKLEEILKEIKGV